MFSSVFSVNYTSVFVLIFIVGSLLNFSIDQFLEFIDYRARCKNHGLPEEIKSYKASEAFNQDKLKTICEYENAKYFSFIPFSILTLVLEFVLVLSGLYPFLFSKIINLVGTPDTVLKSFLCVYIFYTLISLPSSILDIPFDLYKDFHLEKKFGFSNMTFKLWIKDFVMNMILGLILSAIIIFCISAFLLKVPNHWWILVTIFMFALTLIMQILYPLVIAPLFNKFTPLEDGELKDKITSLMENIGFKSSGIFVVDASKRSGHSNAYFTGFGKSKRIVLFDTLIKQLTTDELVAVLGHELGHFKLRHILHRFFVMIPIEFIVLYVCNYLCHNTALYEAFGFHVEEVLNVQFIGLLLISLVFGSLISLLSPVINHFSRRDEYQADAYSSDLTGKPEDLISGLIKLNSENLSELLPPKLYVMWKYSHPTLVERIRALNKK